MSGLKTIFSTATTDTMTTDVEGVGKLRFEGASVFRWVKNVNTSVSFALGDVVYHNYTDSTGQFTENIDRCVTANLGFMAGVVCGSFDANTGSNPKIYGWIQVRGRNNTCKVTPTNTATTAGPLAGNSLIGVNAQKWAATGQAMGTAAVYTRNISCIDAVVAGTAAVATNCYVNCL